MSAALASLIALVAAIALSMTTRVNVGIVAIVSINVGSSLVDVSPLSTLGALCLAALPDPTAAPRMFRQLLLWGVVMAAIGALLCQVFAGPFARL